LLYMHTYTARLNPQFKACMSYSTKQTYCKAVPRSPVGTSLHLQYVESFIPKLEPAGAENNVILPRRNRKARSRSMTQKSTAFYSSRGDARGLCTMDNFFASAGKCHMTADLFPGAPSLDQGEKTTQLPMVLPRSCIMLVKAVGSSSGGVVNKVKSTKEETVGEEQVFDLQSLREVLPKSINGETAGKKEVFDLQCLREVLPEANPQITVQLLSGRVVWNSSRSSMIQTLQSAAGLQCTFCVYDIKRALEDESETHVRTRLTFQKIFRSDALAEFHAACIDDATMAPKPLADNIIVPPGTTLTVCRVAEQNEVDEVQMMLQGWNI